MKTAAACSSSSDNRVDRGGDASRRASLRFLTLTVCTFPCGVRAHVRPRRPPDAADYGGSESLMLVLVFAPEAAAFEAGLRELLHSVSVTSNVSLICANGGGERVLSFFSFLL